MSLFSRNADGSVSYTTNGIITTVNAIPSANEVKKHTTTKTKSLAPKTNNRRINRQAEDNEILVTDILLDNSMTKTCVKVNRFFHIIGKNVDKLPTVTIAHFRQNENNFSRFVTDDVFSSSDFIVISRSEIKIPVPRTYDPVTAFNESGVLVRAQYPDGELFSKSFAIDRAVKKVMTVNPYLATRSRFIDRSPFVLFFPDTTRAEWVIKWNGLLVARMSVLHISQAAADPLLYPEREFSSWRVRPRDTDGSFDESANDDAEWESFNMRDGYVQTNALVAFQPHPTLVGQCSAHIMDAYVLFTPAATSFSQPGTYTLELESGSFTRGVGGSGNFTAEIRFGISFVERTTGLAGSDITETQDPCLTAAAQANIPAPDDLPPNSTIDFTLTTPYPAFVLEPPETLSVITCVDDDN